MMDARDLLRRSGRGGRLAFCGLALALAAFAAGCRDSGPAAAVYSRQAGDPSPLRIAVIPFSSPANAPGAGEAVTSTVITYLLASRAVEVVEPGEVDRAMRAVRYAPESSAGLDTEMVSSLQQQLQVDAYLIGNVEEYGEVRVGPDSYPSVSFSARLVRASDNAIVWAASISRTGADRVKVFDIGRVSSLGKLTKSAVGEMAASFRRDVPNFAAAGRAARPAAAAAHPEAPTPSPIASFFADESKVYGIADLTALLHEVAGFTRGEVRHSRHFHDTVSCLYAIEGGAISVRLVDYQKTLVAAEAVREESAGLAPAKVGALNGFAGPAPAHSHGAAALNVTLGRFGLYLTGPQSAAEKMAQLAAAIAAGK